MFDIESDDFAAGLHGRGREKCVVHIDTVAWVPLAIERTGHINDFRVEIGDDGSLV